MMGNSRTDEKEKPPASTSPLIQANNDYSMSIAQNIHAARSVIFREGNGVGGHFASGPNMPLPIAPSWENMYLMNQSIAQGNPEPSGNPPMPDFLIPNSFQNPQINLSCDFSNINLPEGSQYVNQDHNSISVGAGISNQNPTISRNFAGDSKYGHFNRPQVNRDIVGSPLLFRPKDSAPVHSRNSVNFNTSQCGVQEKVDGSFLSLGIGGTEEAISRSQLSSREVSDKLKEAASAELKMAGARKVMGQALDAGFSGFQINTSGFSNQLCHLDQRTPNSEPGSSPYHIQQTQQNDMQHGITRHDDTNSSFSSNKNVRYNSDHYRAFVGNQASHSGTLGGNSPRFFNSHQNDLNSFAPESAMPSWITSHMPSGQPQNVHFKAANSLSSECNMISPSLGPRSCSTRQNYAVQQLLSHNSMGTQGLGGSVFSQRITASQVARISGAQAATEGPFPKRLGVEFSGRDGLQAAERHLFSKGTSMQTISTGQMCQFSEKGSTRVSNHLHQPPFIDRTDGVPINYPTNSQGTFFSHGQSQDSLVQISKDPRESASSDGSTQRSNYYSRPYLKRTAGAPPTASHWVQRQKITQPTAHPSIPIPSQIKPAGPIAASGHPSITYPSHFRRHIPVTSAPIVAHITRKDPDGTKQLTGHKCLLCKRDLSLTSEGAVYQPAIPPAVAVLPCGHTFHDQCLRNITPEDELKDPPCIPCAIGEN